MGCIADRTNRVLAPPTYQEYYKALAGELTNDEFVEAARLVFRNAQFWPSPKDFIDAIRPDPRLEGMQAFDRLRIDMPHRTAGVTYWIAEEIEHTLGLAALVAFRAIGGSERINTMATGDIAFTARDFADAYVRAKTDAAKPPPLQTITHTRAPALLQGNSI